MTAWREMLGALWAWCWFGGVGARTRRGFGALIVRDVQGDAIEPWQPTFLGPRRDDPAAWSDWLNTVAELADPQPGGRLWPPKLLLGPIARSASEAHAATVRALFELRQGPGIGRKPGGRRPGRSHWPEADLLRGQAGGADFEHPPPAGATRFGAPRAAFGMPLEIQFKDRREKQANGRLLPVGGERKPSPVLLGVLPAGGRRQLTDAGDGPCRPAVLFLREAEGAGEVRIELDRGKKGTAPLISAEGATGSIRSLLRQTGGNALRAFKIHLQHKHGFEAVPLEEQP